MNMSVIDEFYRLCKQSEDAYDEDTDVSFESTLVDILNFIKSNKESRIDLIKALKDVARRKDLPLEIVSFCMREMQWEELKEYAIKRINESNDPRSMALKSIIEAYDAHWPDAEMYLYYRS